MRPKLKIVLLHSDDALVLWLQNYAELLQCIGKDPFCPPGIISGVVMPNSNKWK